MARKRNLDAPEDVIDLANVSPLVLKNKHDRNSTPREDMLLLDFLEKIVADEYYHPRQHVKSHSRALGERRLVEAIIERACMDVCGHSGKAKWEAAARWINGDDNGEGEFDDYCFYLKANPEAIRERLVKLNAIPKKGSEYDYTERRRHRVRWRAHRGKA